MTEAEWLTYGQPDNLLGHLQNHPRNVSERKLRMYCCARLRRVWRSLGPKSGARRLAEFAEAYADGLGTTAERAHAEAEAKRLVGTIKAYNTKNVLHALWWSLAEQIDAHACMPIGWGTEFLGAGDREAKRAAGAHLLRDIFGNPFRPVAFDPRWRTADVLALARGIYDERAFDRLQLLADALMDAGCDHEDVLAHCRGDGPHVRGCWVVDLVLGKE
jgi:hypothetical protein